MRMLPSGLPGWPEADGIFMGALWLSRSFSYLDSVHRKKQDIAFVVHCGMNDGLWGIYGCTPRARRIANGFILPMLVADQNTATTPGPADGRRFGLFFFREFSTIPPCLRSEEHTSELQS